MPIMTSKIARPVFGLALLILAAPFLAADGSGATETTGTLSETDARILVYVSPIGERVRASGSDIAMERQASPQLNQADYYYFWVYDAKRPSNGSVTIGYYAVDKYTGDVWDTDQKRQLSGEVLLGVQKIIQQSHRINEDTIRNHRHKPF